MVFVPAQGFRHAATLLLANGARAIPAGASAGDTRAALERLAHDLVALADDTRTPADASEWLIAEFCTTIDRLPQSVDREDAKAMGTLILGRVASRVPSVDSRDLFLIYVPEDRLPVAAPLAVELTKRRVSVAFADYEVGSAAEFAAAVAHGLAHHRGGAVLWTKAFQRAHWPPPAESDRVRILHNCELPAAVADLTAFVNQNR